MAKPLSNLSHIYTLYTVSHFTELPREDEKQEQKRDFKAISFFFFFFFLKAEAKWKLSVMAGALPWGQGLGDLLALVAEVSHSANLGSDPAEFWWLSPRTMWP